MSVRFAILALQESCIIRYSCYIHFFYIIQSYACTVSLNLRVGMSRALVLDSAQHSMASCSVTCAMYSQVICRPLSCTVVMYCSSDSQTFQKPVLPGYHLLPGISFAVLLIQGCREQFFTFVARYDYFTSWHTDVDLIRVLCIFVFV